MKKKLIKILMTFFASLLAFGGLYLVTQASFKVMLSYMAWQIENDLEKPQKATVICQDVPDLLHEASSLWTIEISVPNSCKTPLCEAIKDKLEKIDLRQRRQIILDRCVEDFMSEAFANLREGNLLWADSAYEQAQRMQFKGEFVYNMRFITYQIERANAIKNDPQGKKAKEAAKEKKKRKRIPVPPKRNKMKNFA